MTSRSSRALAFTAFTALAACGGSNEAPHHPVQEISARATAKLDVLDLVVSDPARADRLRGIYLEVWKLGRDFDLARAGALEHARRAAAARTTIAAQSTPGSSTTLERTMVPPIEVGRAAFERYTELMLEARALLSKDEFEKLDRVR